ncbi:MAG TPA: OmpA family protein, partial [Steroidobacteraceae bacterium]|nr:OmpA family protein [Steroidobacteraceae bacterium]
MRRDSDCSCHGQSQNYEALFDELQYEGTVTGPKPAGKSGVVVAPGTTTPMVRFACLWKFPFKGTTMPAEHADLVTRVAHLILASRNFFNPITQVRLVGHTDDRGSDKVNIDYGRKRAEDVRKRLIARLDALQPGLSQSVTIVADTGGESAPLRPHSAANAAFNRRVEVYLPRNCQTFFAQMDLRSLPDTPILGIAAHPNITDKALRAEQVKLVVGALVRRRDARAKMAADGKVMGAKPVDKAKTPKLHAAVQALSTMQLELFREYFGGKSIPLSIPGFMTCFERFANGQLRSPHAAFAGAGVGEPEGGFFFLFAEFAMLCYDTRIDWRIWEQTLPSLIAPQEIFMHVYHPTPMAPPPINAPLPAKGPVKTSLDAYSFRNFRPIGGSVVKGVGQSDSQRINKLRTKYRGMSFLNLRKAIAQNMLRA